MSTTPLCKLFLLALLLCPLVAKAQGGLERGVQQAERVFALLRSAQADSIISLFSDEMRSQVGADLLADVWPQLESAMGPYVEHGPWERREQDSFSVYTSTVTFGQGRLTLLVALDEELRVAGLRLFPIATEEADDEPLPDGVVELTDTVHTGTGISLPCTVTISGHSACPPMVVMVHGSGPLDRDETVMANKTFRDLARQLAEHGISSLRYDKRTFVYHDPVTTMDDEVVSDALSALSLARTYNNNVYLLGHSLGAMLAPVIAQRADERLAGIIMMAAPARELAEVVVEQVDYLMPEGTASDDKRQAIDQLRQQAPHYFEPQHQVDVAQALTGMPMLIMQGGRDYQVSMTDFSLWQQALEGRADVTLRAYDNLNHLFLPGEGKSTPQEYMQRGTIPAEVIGDIVRFIHGDNGANGAHQL